MTCYLLKNALKKTNMSNLKIHLIKYFTPKTRILILGPLELTPKVLKRICKRMAPTLILLIDGGIRHKSSIPISLQENILSLGDGDSSDKRHGPLMFQLPTKKKFSDLAFVTEAMISCPLSFDQIELLGFINHQHLEKRIDHLLFNIGVIQHLTSQLNQKILMDEKFLFLPPGIAAFNYNGLFSTLSLTANRLKITGSVEYKLLKWTSIMPLETIGLSNIASGKVQINTKEPMMIYFAGSKFSW